MNACRETGTPKTLKDIVATSNIKHKTIARNCRLLIRELDIKAPIVDPMKCISRVANAAEVTEKTKCHVLNIMNEVIKRQIPAGKYSMDLAATILYASCKKTRIQKSG